MSNAVCAFIYDYPDAIRAAFNSKCKHIVEIAPEQTTFTARSIGNDSALSLSVTSRSAYRHLIAKEICREISSQVGALDEETFKAIQTTLHESITNSIIHGNLDINSNYSSSDEMEAFFQAVKDALRQEEYGNKRIYIDVNYPQPGEIIITVTDEGEGFDFEQALKDAAHSNQRDGKAHGMGITLLKSLTQRIEYSNYGRTIALHFKVPERALSVASQKNITESEQIRNDICILVVDDMEYNRYIIRSILNSNGYDNIIDATNGAEAMKQLQTQTPDLIISDLTMPQMDGFELCKAVRRMPEFISTPIIVQTAMMNVEERIKAFDYGANDIIEQPVHSKELMARIELHMERANSFHKLEEFRSRIQMEIELARQMHLNLIPSKQELDEIETRYGLEISNYFESSSEIGGDVWGIIPISDSEIGFYSCDFTGHGVGAAINTFRLNATMDNFEENAAQPGLFLKALNQWLYNILPTEQFATFFYGVIDIKNGDFRYSAAGAPNPVFYSKKTGESITIDSSGVPLGVVRNHEYGQTSISMLPGDAIFLYSDALIETTSIESGNFLGIDGLRSTIQEHLSKTPVRQQSIIHSFLKQLGLLQGAECDDDLTMVLISLKDKENQSVSTA